MQEQELLWVAGSAPTVVPTLLFIWGSQSLGKPAIQAGPCPSACSTCVSPGHLNRGSCLASIQLECLESGGGLAAFQPLQEGLLRTWVLQPREDTSVKADWYSVSSPQQAVCAPASPSKLPLYGVNSSVLGKLPASNPWCAAA